MNNKSFFNIIGTSNLNFKSTSWEKLKKFGNYNFGDYGNIYKYLFSKKNENLILILCLRDILDFNNTKKKNNEILKFLLNTLEKSLNKNSKTTFLCFDTSFNLSILERAKTNNDLLLSVDRFIIKIKKLSKKYNNLLLVDLDYEIAKYGVLNCTDQRNWYFAKCRYSSLGLEVISKSISSILERHFNIANKVLILDCDNTLWGGIIAEDKINGIKIGEDGFGRMFSDFQKVIKKISDEGIIIGLASKNIEEDVMRVFNTHEGMVLKQKDLIITRINWKEKSDNLRSISKELSISLESMAFWDDNPIEREKVKKNIPEINVIDVPENTQDWAEYLFSLNDFSKFSKTKEDYKKKKHYQIRKKFTNDIKNKKENENSFLKSIKIKPKIKILTNSLIKRAHQMLHKTNQLNFTNKKYSEIILKKMTKSKKNILLMISLKDIYGDHGNVGLIIMTKINKKVVVLDNFLMSCRVIGRQLEEWMFCETIKYLKKLNVKKLLVILNITKRNIIAQQILKKLNLKNVKIKKFPNAKLLTEGKFFLRQLDVVKFKKKFNLYE